MFLFFEFITDIFSILFCTVKRMPLTKNRLRAPFCRPQNEALLIDDSENVTLQSIRVFLAELSRAKRAQQSTMGKKMW